MVGCKESYSVVEWGIGRGGSQGNKWVLLVQSRFLPSALCLQQNTFLEQSMLLFNHMIVGILNLVSNT